MTAPRSTDDDSCTGPPVTPERVAEVEQETGYRFPAAYVALLGERNGGELVRDACRTDRPTGWADDHFRVGVLLGVGPADGSITASAYLIEEWDLPVTGLVVSSTPCGHDWVLLDHGTCGPRGEPSVAYVCEDLGGGPGYDVRTAAPDMEAFLAALVEDPDPG